MKPLQGYRILDFTQFLSGPSCTRILGDLGAEIIKFEKPPFGDEARYYKAIKGNKSTNWATRNRGKKSAIMDLNCERQKALVFKLLESADAVVENYKVGTIEKFGLSYETMRQINPKIVLTSISGYGQTGPYKAHTAYDAMIQGEGGLISVTGDKDGHPVRAGTFVSDLTGGILAAVGTLAALLDAQRTGEGRHVDISLLDGVVMQLDNYIGNYFETGEIAKPAGNLTWSACPFRDFKCRDDNMILLGIATDDQFRRFAKVLNHEDWLNNPDYETIELRVQHREELEYLIQKEIEANYTRDELIEKLQSQHLAYGNINDIAGVAVHPQVKSRNMIVNGTFTDGSIMPVVGNPIKMSNMENPTSYHVADIGEDTFDVFKEVASLEELHNIFDSTLELSKKAVLERNAVRKGWSC